MITIIAPEDREKQIESGEATMLGIAYLNMKSQQVEIDCVGTLEASALIGSMNIPGQWRRKSKEGK